MISGSSFCTAGCGTGGGAPKPLYNKQPRMHTLGATYININSWKARLKLLYVFIYLSICHTQHYGYLVRLQKKQPHPETVELCWLSAGRNWHRRLGWLVHVQGSRFVRCQRSRHHHRLRSLSLLLGRYQTPRLKESWTSLLLKWSTTIETRSGSKFSFWPLVYIYLSNVIMYVNKWKEDIWLGSCKNGYIQMKV